MSISCVHIAGIFVASTCLAKYSSSTLSSRVSSGSSPEHSLVALLQKINVSFLVLLGRTMQLCHPEMKSILTLHLSIAYACTEILSQKYSVVAS